MFYTKAMRATLLIPILCLFLATAGAAEPAGSTLSLMLEDELTQSGFICAREQLAATAQDEFPFNLEVYLRAADSAPAAQDAQRDTIIFSFLQEEAFARRDAMVAFLRRLKETTLPCTVIVLFAAQDDSPFNPALSGTDVFAQNFEENDRAAAVTVRFADSTAILTGNAGMITPRWLAQQLTEAFDRAGIAYRYPHRFSSLYRAGFLRGDRRMAACIRNGIPAAAVTLASEQVLDALAAFAGQFSTRNTELWDNHYIFLRLPHPLANGWIGERFFFLSCLILGTLFLLILCSFSFVGKNGRGYRQDFKRTWYLIPLTIAVTYLSFWLGQVCCQFLLARASPVMQFGTKLLFTLFFISLLFAVWQSRRGSTEQVTHGYFIYLSGIVNIFVFTAVDLSFFALFLLEYALIYVARKATRIVPLAISVFLMLLPFLPYVFQLLRHGYYIDLRPLVFSPPLYNLLLAMLVFPFLIMWLRMLVSLGVYAGNGRFSLRTMAFHGSLSTLAIMAVTLLSVIVLSVFSRQMMRRTFRQIHAVAEDRGTFVISVTQDDFHGMTTRNVTVTSKERAAHYDITLASESAIPLFDANYDYTVNEDTKTATFIVPDFPPQTMTILYETPPDDEDTIAVTAWYATDEELVYRQESHRYRIGGGS